MKKNKFFAISTLLFIISCILQIMAHSVKGFSDWYATILYPMQTRIVGTVTSRLPFSIAEFLLYVGLIGLGASVLWGIYLFFRNRGGRRKYWIGLMKGAFCTASILLFLYTINCGVNYQRTGFFESISAKEEEFSTEELYQLTDFFAQTTNELSAEIGSDIPDMQKEAIASMKNLGSTYPGLAGFYPSAKPVFHSEFLSYQQLTGIYSPFTVEANYNNDMPELYKPFTICHELAHVKGYMKEEEANYIAIMACLNSESKEFQYSGALLAYTYCSNALYGSDKEKSREVASHLTDFTKQWLVANSQFWKQYEGQVAKVSEKANDLYLKANAQTAGIKSYGMVVDLLLTEFEKNKEEDASFVNRN